MVGEVRRPHPSIAVMRAKPKPTVDDAEGIVFAVVGLEIDNPTLKSRAARSNQRRKPLRDAAGRSNADVANGGSLGGWLTDPDGLLGQGLFLHGHLHLLLPVLRVSSPPQLQPMRLE